MIIINNYPYFSTVEKLDYRNCAPKMTNYQTQGLEPSKYMSQLYSIDAKSVLNRDGSRLKSSRDSPSHTKSSKRINNDNTGSMVRLT